MVIYAIPRGRQKAIHHFEVALGIASSFGWQDALFWVHYSLAWLFIDQDWFDDAQTHIERARSYTNNHAFYLGLAMQFQARLWYKRNRLEEARSEALRAVGVYEKLGATKDLKRCSGLFQQIEEEMTGWS